MEVLREVPEVPEVPEDHEGAFYVRIRLPSDYVKPVTNIKQLTLNIIKFGVAYSVYDRHRGYMRDPDNGYMAFSFTCCSRQEADIVESFIKYEFASLTVLNSREYLDARRLAEALGVPYTTGYAEYVSVARALFVRMVERVKLNFPEKYANIYGTIYSIEETVLCAGVIDTSTLTFPGTIITRDLAAEFGFRNPTTRWIPIADVQHQKEDASPSTAMASRSTTTRPKSNGTIMAVDLVTGEVEEHNTIEKGAGSIVFTPSSLKSIVNSDTFRQVAGKVWCWTGGPFWIPPIGLQVDINARPNNIRYIKRTENADVKVYENPTIAAQVHGQIAKNITHSAEQKKPINGVVWSWVPQHELTVTTNDVGQVVGRTTIIEIPKNGADGRCHGKIICRDIITGVEETYVSAYDAACKNSRSKEDGCRTDLTQKMVSDHLLDKMRPANGKVFRSFDATMRWQPPSYYVRNPKNVTEIWPNSCNTASGLPWIVSTDESGKVLGLYETKKTAYEVADISRDQLKKIFDNGILMKGKFWRFATKEECGDWIPCTPHADLISAGGVV